MPTFTTAQPITVTVGLGVGDLSIDAGDRTDTVVEVRPGNPESRSGMAAAAQTRVDYADGHLLIQAPRGWRQWAPRRGGGSVNVHVELPAGSDLQAETGLGTVRCRGRLGACRITTGLGDIDVEQAGAGRFTTAKGHVTVGTVSGGAELTTGSGALQVGRVDGAAVVKNSNGDSRIGEVSGPLRVRAANGRISVDQAHASVVAKTANGDIRLGEVSRGAIVAATASGGVDVGIREGVAAWLDLHSGYGTVSNDLDATRPEAGEETVEVRARSAYGDINVRRCRAAGPVPAGVE